jgi:tetratricopeptide (TPR) repeat protein
MIVRNEAQIIKRCLDAAKPLIDYVSICDTGSTDRTVTVIEEWLQTNGIPGKVHKEVWKNFGHNRSLSYKRAKKTFPEATYLMLVDADMVLVVHPSFKKEELIADGYQIYQTEGGMKYRNVRLIKASLPWKSFGPTHEFTGLDNSKIQLKVEPLDTIEVDDRSDGGCKDDKLDRDATLLIQGLKEEPTNGRYMFYLAQTYYCMGQYLDSIFWYEKRSLNTKDAFEEEIWYSIYRIGQSYEAVHNYPKMVYWYLKAIGRRPHRIEPYVRLAKHWIFNDHDLQYWNGCQLLKQGLKLARPEVDVLFVELSMYQYEAYWALSVGSYYIKRYHEGRAACMKVLSCPSTPGNMREGVYKFLNEFYGDKLPPPMTEESPLIEKVIVPSPEASLEQHILFFTNALKQNPKDGRTMFQLAHVFLKINRYLDAIEWFEKSLNNNTLKDEVWCAMVRIAQCFEKLKDYPFMVYWYLKAIAKQPHRIEPYVYLGKHWIFNDKEINYWNGCALIKEGLGMAQKSSDALFVDTSAYEYEPWFALAVGSYYIGRSDEGKSASQKLLTMQGVPEPMKVRAKEFLQVFYR